LLISKFLRYHTLFATIIKWPMILKGCTWFSNFWDIFQQTAYPGPIKGTLSNLLESSLSCKNFKSSLWTPGRHDLSVLWTEVWLTIVRSTAEFQLLDLDITRKLWLLESPCPKHGGVFPILNGSTTWCFWHWGVNLEFEWLLENATKFEIFPGHL